MAAIRFEPTAREISEILAILIAGGHEEQISHHETGSDDMVYGTCPECDGRGFAEVFDDDYFDPIGMVWIWGTLEYQTYPCHNCKQTGSVSLMEVLRKENERAKPEPYLGSLLKKEQLSQSMKCLTFLHDSAEDGRPLSDDELKEIFSQMAEDAHADPELYN